MDEFIAKKLQFIEENARKIIADIRGIFGYCNGVETVANCEFAQSIPLITYGNGFGNHHLIQEIKTMIVELKIKGSVRERANGLIELRTQALGSIYGRTKDEIEQKLTKALKETRKYKNKLNNAEKNKSLLLSEFFVTHYLPYKNNQGRSVASMESYESLFRYIEKSKFDKTLTTYKSTEIEDFLYSIPYERTRQMLQGFLNNMFKRALTLGLVKVNPCASIEKVQHTQKQGTAFSFDEQSAFFDNLAKTDLPYSEKCYFVFVYLTGTRRQEALGVAVEDVDFKNKVLHIRGTKTKGSDREVPLTPLVEKLLLSLRVENGRYFPIDIHRVNKSYNKIRGMHKLHDLRHTYGTIQVCVDKIDVKTVSLFMGHSTVSTTLSIYTHPEQLDKATFLRGDLTSGDKLDIYRTRYKEILIKADSLVRK